MFRCVIASQFANWRGNPYPYSVNDTVKGRPSSEIGGRSMIAPTGEGVFAKGMHLCIPNGTDESVPYGAEDRCGGELRVDS